VSKNRLLLLDGHSLAYRAFYALPVENFATSTGQPTNAVYGLASMLINLIASEKPTHIAVAFDVSRKTFRSEKFPEYKANRSASPDEFKSQSSYLNKLIDVFNIKRFALEGFEADDIIATLTKRAEAADFETLICTGDRDSFQLINAKTTVLYPKKGVTDLSRMTPEAVLEKYGLTPNQYPDFAALRGDPSDNLPSIPGVGEKTAAKWIIEYGSLKNLIKNASDISGKAGESLRANLKNILLNQELTQLKSDVEIDTDISELSWSGINIEETSSLFKELEIKALQERIKSIAPSAISKPIQSKKSTSQVTSISATELSNRITSPIAIDFKVVESVLQSYAVRLSNGESYLITGAEIGDWVKDPEVKKYVHNAKVYGHWHEINGIVFDTELAAYLVNSGSRSLALGDLSQKYLDESLEEQESLFSDLNTRNVEIIWNLVPILQKELAEREMDRLYYEMEIPIANLLSKIERIGIAVDLAALKEELKYFKEIVDAETKSAHESAGKEFNVNSPKQLQSILFEDLGLPKTKKNKTGYTTDAEGLQWLYEKSKHPILKNLLRIRETSKLLSVVEGLISAVDMDGRIHTEFQQTVAATGRLSSTNPNLQNIPVRTEEGRRIRSHFITKAPYANLFTADYSQIELRIIAHLSKDQELITALNSGEDLHSTMASLVFGVAPEKVDPEMRRQIKAMSYGLAYGLSSYGLAAQLDISPGAALSLMERYLERFGGIQRYLKSIVAEAKKKGYTETMFGRRRYLPDLNHENRVRREIAERAALNAPIQGSAADIIKIAMLNFEKLAFEKKLKSRLVLQVHDELIFEVAKGEENELEDLVRAAMGGAAKLSIELAVNTGFGKSWSDAAH
jgi:DNA polymerase I